MFPFRHTVYPVVAVLMKHVENWSDVVPSRTTHTNNSRIALICFCYGFVVKCHHIFLPHRVLVRWKGERLWKQASGISTSSLHICRVFKPRWPQINIQMSWNYKVYSVSAYRGVNCRGWPAAWWSHYRRL